MQISRGLVYKSRTKRKKILAHVPPFRVKFTQSGRFIVHRSRRMHLRHFCSGECSRAPGRWRVKSVLFDLEARPPLINNTAQ
jgi:hypothetical protein